MATAAAVVRTSARVIGVGTWQMVLASGLVEALPIKGAREFAHAPVGATEDRTEVAEAERLEVQRRDFADGLRSFIEVLAEHAAREHEAAQLMLHGVADDQYAARWEVEGDASVGVSGGVDDTETTKDRDFVGIVEHDIDPRRARVGPLQEGIDEPGEKRVNEWIGKWLLASDVGRIGKVNGCTGGDMLLEDRESANMIDVRVRDYDVADVVGRFSDFAHGSEDAFARAGVASIDDCDGVFDDEVGAGAARPDLEKPGDHLASEAEGGRAPFFPTSGHFRAPRVDLGACLVKGSRH